MNTFDFPFDDLACLLKPIFEFTRETGLSFQLFHVEGLVTIGLGTGGRFHAIAHKFILFYLLCFIIIGVILSSKVCVLAVLDQVIFQSCKTVKTKRK